MQNSRHDESQAGMKIARRNMNDLRCADYITLMAESEEGSGGIIPRRAEGSLLGEDSPFRHQCHGVVSDVCREERYEQFFS